MMKTRTLWKWERALAGGASWGRGLAAPREDRQGETVQILGEEKAEEIY